MLNVEEVLKENKELKMKNNLLEVQIQKLYNKINNDKVYNDMYGDIITYLDKEKSEINTNYESDSKIKELKKKISKKKKELNSKENSIIELNKKISLLKIENEDLKKTIKLKESNEEEFLNELNDIQNKIISNDEIHSKIKDIQNENLDLKKEIKKLFMEKELNQSNYSIKNSVYEDKGSFYNNIKKRNSNTNKDSYSFFPHNSKISTNQNKFF